MHRPESEAGMASLQGALLEPGASDGQLVRRMSTPLAPAGSAGSATGQLVRPTRTGAAPEWRRARQAGARAVLAASLIHAGRVWLEDKLGPVWSASAACSCAAVALAVVLYGWWSALCAVAANWLMVVVLVTAAIASLVLSAGAREWCFRTSVKLAGHAFVAWREAEPGVVLIAGTLVRATVPPPVLRWIATVVSVAYMAMSDGAAAAAVEGAAADAALSAPGGRSGPRGAPTAEIDAHGGDDDDDDDDDVAQWARDHPGAAVPGNARELALAASVAAGARREPEARPAGVRRVTAPYAGDAPPRPGAGRARPPAGAGAAAGAGGGGGMDAGWHPSGGFAPDGPSLRDWDPDVRPGRAGAGAPGGGGGWEGQRGTEAPLTQKKRGVLGWFRRRFSRKAGGRDASEDAEHGLGRAADLPPAARARGPLSATPGYARPASTAPSTASTTGRPPRRHIQFEPEPERRSPVRARWRGLDRDDDGFDNTDLTGSVGIYSVD